MQDPSDNVDGKLRSTISVIPQYVKARDGGVHAASIQHHGPTATRNRRKARGARRLPAAASVRIQLRSGRWGPMRSVREKIA